MVGTGKVCFGSAVAVVARDTGQFVGGYAEQFDPKKGVRLFHGSIAAALQFSSQMGKPVSHDPKQMRLSVGSLEWTLNPNQALLAQWTRSASPFPTFEYSDALRILEDPSRRDRFRDKLVILGDARGSDMATTQPFGDIPGVDFMAQMTNTALLPFSARTALMPDPIFAFLCLILGSISFASAAAKNLGLLCIGPPAATAASFLAPYLTVPVTGVTIDTWVAASTVAVCTALGLVSSQTALSNRTYRPAGLEEDSTVVFLDLVSSTELLGRLGTARYTRVIADLLREGAIVIRRHGGSVERTTGDGFVAVFRGRYRKPHTERSIDAAREILRVAQRIGRKHTFPLRLAIGIESGEVGGAYVEEGGRKTWMSSGRAVNLAQRLMASCNGFGIAIAVGPCAQARVGFEYPLHSVGKFKPRGFNDEVEVSTLVLPEENLPNN